MDQNQACAELHRYPVEIHWLLQACYCDHCETREAPKKDDPTKTACVSQVPLTAGRDSGVVCNAVCLRGSLPGRGLISRDGLTLLWRCLFAWPVASFG